MAPARRTGRPQALLLALALGAGALVVGTSPHPAAAAGCANAFGGAFASQLARRYPGVRVTAAVHDTRTGCWHHLAPGLQITTASVIKAQVLGAVLLRAQREGRGLTAWERARAAPMIRYSLNPETSALYQHVGSTPGMRATDAAFGVSATSHTATFGLTRSTAADRTNVALRLLHAGGPLTQARRDEAWQLMSTVHPLQQWGITAGVPEGWSVALKNGFYPASGLGWRVGSSGFVRRDDSHQGYAITVMTEGAGDQATGIRLVEEVSSRAAAHLTVGPEAARAVARARCVRTSAGESWAGVAARLGLPAGRAGEVRTLAGGNAAPLGGQRACSPVIPAEPRSSASTVGLRYRPVVTDLDCDGRDDVLWYGPGGAPDTRWAGAADRRFRQRPMAVSGDYVPVAGDFDGDGCGDVLWYGPGARADSVWYGGRTGVDTRPVAVVGTGYHPAVGDFDADGRDDVLWYAPGTAADSLWWGSAGRDLAPSPLAVWGAYEPVVGDLDGDGASDVVWYAPGGQADPVWVGRPGRRDGFAARSTSVGGRYRPVVGDLDGDGADEVLWHAPGPAVDVRWDGLPPSHESRYLSVSGSYLPLAGDLDGDGLDDIAWYGPGGGAESAWWSTPTGHTSGGLVRA